MSAEKFLVTAATGRTGRHTVQQPAVGFSPVLSIGIIHTSLNHAAYPRSQC
jgi:uncharacterized protein YbjT (DUF2867 family)